MAVPHVPYDPEEDRLPVFGAAQQLRRMGVEPVLVEPDSPAQGLRRPAYYVPAGLLHPGAPAAVVIREDPEDDGSRETALLRQGAMHHVAVRLGLASAAEILPCDAPSIPCSPRERALLRRELSAWWSWWSPRRARSLVGASPDSLALKP